MKKHITIALAGNPNTGKTTIFNNLTGARQHVGNYPGVTVERKEGSVNYGPYQIKIIDLPGTYSLTAFSPDELLARQVIIEEKPDIIVNIIDAYNLERNLYLTVQLKELGIPMLLAFNMTDMIAARGIHIDYPLMEKLLGSKIIPTVGLKNVGSQEILKSVVELYEKINIPSERDLFYEVELEKEIVGLQRILQETAVGEVELAAAQDKANRWLAVKLLENDNDIINKFKTSDAWPDITRQVEKSQKKLQDLYREEPEMLIAHGRYAFIRGVLKEAVSYPGDDRVTLTEKIDNILLNRIVGLPIFLAMMWLLFQLTFTLGAPPMEWIEAGFGWLGERMADIMPDGLLQSLIVDGIIGGVGGVVVFLPNILLLFLGIALLEDTGYMSRAAFLMDKVMHRTGLHGKSFVPMLIGFGCSIPAIMASRTLENERDRLATMLVTPLISCGAKLPVYVLLIAAFFSDKVAGNILFSIYILGILMALLLAKVFRKWLLPGETEPFVMELPPYRFPTFKALLIHMWERAWLYLQKAGTIILAASILMWGLFTFPQHDANGVEFNDPVQQLEQSYAGRVGHLIEGVISPLGFDWKVGVALVSGVAAKEVIVSTMGTVYSIMDIDSLEEGEIQTVSSFSERAREQSGMTPLVAYVLMIFTLLYIPCMAALAVMRRETNGWKWPLFTVGYTLVLAWTVSFSIYQVGLLLGIGV